jgi:hypothetical protein
MQCSERREKMRLALFPGGPSERDAPLIRIGPRPEPWPPRPGSTSARSKPIQPALPVTSMFMRSKRSIASRDRSEQRKRTLQLGHVVLANLARTTGFHQRLIDLGKVTQAIEWFKLARSEGRTISVAGNGGSAATASQFVCDVLKGRASARLRGSGSRRSTTRCRLLPLIERCRLRGRHGRTAQEFRPTRGPVYGN